MNDSALVGAARLTAERVSRWSGSRGYVATGDADDEGNVTPLDITFEQKPSRADLVVATGDVLMARMAGTRKVLEVDDATAAHVYSTGFAVLRPEPTRLNSTYLRHWLRTPQFQAAKDRLSVGATQRAITNDGLRKLTIPLPPLAKQQQVAAILDHADAIRIKQRQVLRHLDSLTGAIFHEMFGDPRSNNRGMPQKSIGTLADVVTGNSPSRADAANFGDDIEWIKSDNLGGPVATPASERLSALGRARARIAPKGSILVTCIAGSPTSIGKASIVDRDVAFNQQINAILPSPSVDEAFLLGQLNTAPDLVRAKSTGGMKGLVNKSAFQSILVLAPPVELQREYAERVRAIGRQRTLAERALATVEELFTSLEARVFSGEL